MNNESKTECIYKVRIERDISYLDPSRNEKMDLYIPVDVNNKKYWPGIVVIHGGGWMFGDRTDSREQNICKTISERGYICASINYRLSTEWSSAWPQTLYDCKTAVQYLRKDADRWGIDPNNIGVLGCSAGAHLAAMLGTVGPEANMEPNWPHGNVSTGVQAVVAMYGVYNLKEFKYKLDCKPWKPRTVVEIFLGVTHEEKPELWNLASPISHIDGNEPPFLLIHGTKDVPVPVKQSIDMYEELRKAGVVSELILVEGAMHSFGLRPAEKDLRPAVAGFFKKYLKGK